MQQGYVKLQEVQDKQETRGREGRWREQTDGGEGAEGREPGGMSFTRHPCSSAFQVEKDHGRNVAEDDDHAGHHVRHKVFPEAHLRAAGAQEGLRGGGGDREQPRNSICRARRASGGQGIGRRWSDDRPPALPLALQLPEWKGGSHLKEGCKGRPKQAAHEVGAGLGKAIAEGRRQEAECGKNKQEEGIKHWRNLRAVHEG